MGGPCDEKISAETKDEMMGNAMAHLESAHPEMAAQVKAMPKDDPMMVSWSQKFEEDWANAVETA